MRFLVPFSFFSFFLSGFSALIYELTWVRLLKNIFGSDSLALSTMLTVFIGGIGLGALISGRLINKSFAGAKTNIKYKSIILLSLYAVFELVLGAYALAVPTVFGQHLIGLAWDAVAALTVQLSWLAAFTKFIFAFCLLIFPTLLMGLGFPLISEVLIDNHNSSKNERYQDREIIEDDYKLVISNLYATNTLGSILGSLVCGFYMLPLIGLRTSVYLGSLINFFIVFLILILLLINSKIFKNVQIDNLVEDMIKTIQRIFDFSKLFDAKEPKAINASERRYQYVCKVLLGIAFAIGFVNLSLEILWTKLLSLVIGSSTYSLTIILIAVLSGISMGAYALNPILKVLHKINFDYLNLLKVLLFLFAGLLAISFSLFNSMPWIFLFLNQKISSLLEISSSSGLWMVEVAVKFLVSLFVVFPVTFVEGVIFAFVLFLMASNSNLLEETLMEPVGTRVAKASYFNTFGAITGSFFTGFILIPFLSNFGSGTLLTSKFFIVLCFLFFLIPFLLEEDPDWIKSISAIAVVITLSLWFLPKFQINTMLSGVSIYHGHYLKNIDKKAFDKVNSEQKEKILYHKEGANAIVTVVENKSANAIFLKSNGKVEAGKPIDPNLPSKADMVTQVLLGAIPVLLNPDSQKAILIGMGSGVTLKTLSLAGSNQSLKQIDVCEIESRIFEAADRYFTNKYPLNPKIKRYVIDARNYIQAKKLTATASPYDIIISQPSDPWISGSLFTYEFWSMSEKIMSENGVFVQWLQLYSMDPAYLNIAIRTFQKVFPETLIFKTANSAELILVGSKSPFSIRMQKIREILTDKKISLELQRIGVENEADFFANLLLDPKSVKEYLEDSLNQGIERDLADKTNFVKFVKNIGKQTTLYKPSLTKEDLQKSKPQKQIIYKKSKPRLNTDNNMMLEFHVSRKLQDFYSTISKNISALSEYASPDNLIEFFAESGSNDFLFELAQVHASRFNWGETLITYNIDTKNIDYEKEFNRSINGRFAEGISTALQIITKTPAGFLTLYNVYLAELLPEKSFSMLYSSMDYYSENITREQIGDKFKVMIFEGLVDTKSILSDFQLYCLAYLHFLNSNFDMATDLLTLSYEMLNQENRLNDYHLQKYKVLEFKILSGKTLKNSSSDPSAQIDDLRKLLGKILILDNLKSSTYLDLALSLKPLLETRSEDFAVLKSDYLALLEKSQFLNPNNYIVHEMLGEYYFNLLPHSQLQLLDKQYQEDLSKTIAYFKSSLELNPFGIKSNYFMSQIQYLIANIELAYKHSSRLTALCELSLLCSQNLSEDQLKNAEDLQNKLNKIFSNKPNEHSSVKLSY
jgi:spermidine synthase